MASERVITLLATNRENFIIGVKRMELFSKSNPLNLSREFRSCQLMKFCQFCRKVTHNKRQR